MSIYHTIWETHCLFWQQKYTLVLSCSCLNWQERLECQVASIDKETLKNLDLSYLQLRRKEYKLVSTETVNFEKAKQKKDCMYDLSWPPLDELDEGWSFSSGQGVPKTSWWLPETEGLADAPSPPWPVHEPRQPFHEDGQKTTSKNEVVQSAKWLTSNSLSSQLSPKQAPSFSSPPHECLHGRRAAAERPASKFSVNSSEPGQHGPTCAGTTFGRGQKAFCWRIFRTVATAGLVTLTHFFSICSPFRQKTASRNLFNAFRHKRRQLTRESCCSCCS